MAIFNDTPPIELRDALSKYRVLFVAWLLQPVGALVLAHLMPAWASLMAFVWFGIAATANLWITALKDAPFKYWALGCGAWFTISLLCLPFYPGVSVGA